MFGQEELAKLAELCRVGARAARTIADARGRDRDAIYALAASAEQIGDALDRIVADGEKDAAPAG